MNIRYETDTLHNELIATIKKPIKVRYINTGKWAWSEHYNRFIHKCQLDDLETFEAEEDEYEYPDGTPHCTFHGHPSGEECRVCSRCYFNDGTASGGGRDFEINEYPEED